MSILESFRTLDYNALREINWQLLAVRLYTVISTVLEAVSKQTLKSGKYLLASLRDETYHLYDDIYLPMPYSSVKHGKASADPSYIYNHDKKIIKPLVVSTGKYQPHVSNILEAKLLSDGKELYDLTDFFDTIEFKSGSRDDFPPILTWLGIWSLETGIVLEKSLKLVLSVEMIDGEKFPFPIWVNDADVQDALLRKWRALNAPMSLSVSSSTVANVPASSSTAVEECGGECAGNCDDCPPGCCAVTSTELPAPTEALERQETTLLSSPVPLSETTTQEVLPETVTEAVTESVVVEASATDEMQG